MSDREAFEKAYHKETGLYTSWLRYNTGYTDVIADMCYRIWQSAQAQAGGGEAVTVEDIVLVTGTVLFSAGSQSEEAITLGQISKYLTDNKLYTHPAPAVPDEILKDAERFRKISKAFDEMKTSRAETFASLLGFNEEEDYLQSLRLLVDRSLIAAARYAIKDLQATAPPAAVNQQLLEALQPLRFDVWADHYEENRLWYEPCEEGDFLYYDEVVAILKTQSQEQQQ